MLSAALRAHHRADENHLIACLPAAVSALWEPHLEEVDLDLGQVTYEAGCSPSYVYFPVTAIISLLYVLENGESAEIAVVGNEGMVGFALIMGGDSTPQPGCCSECRQSPSHEGTLHEARVQTRTSGHAPDVTVHAGLNHADGANGCLQSTSLGGSTALSMALD
jgi:CRP-like cAMP-binding protein